MGESNHDAGSILRRLPSSRPITDPAVSMYVAFRMSHGDDANNHSCCICDIRSDRRVRRKCGWCSFAARVHPNVHRARRGNSQTRCTSNPDYVRVR